MLLYSWLTSGNDIRRYAACSCRVEQKLTTNGYHSGRHLRCEISRGSHRAAETSTLKKGPDLKPTRRGIRGISAVWKSRVLPVGDDRQEEASKRAECLVNPTRMMIYPLVSCGRSLKTVPWVKRCNRLPLLESGANLSALSSECVRPIYASAGSSWYRRCGYSEGPLSLRINPINSW